MFVNVLLGVVVAFLAIAGVALFLTSVLYFIVLALRLTVSLAMLNGGAIIKAYEKSSFKDEIKYVWLRFTTKNK